MTGMSRSCTTASRTASRSSASSIKVEEMNTRRRWSGVGIDPAPSAAPGGGPTTGPPPAGCSGVTWESTEAALTRIAFPGVRPAPMVGRTRRHPARWAPEGPTGRRSRGRSPNSPLLVGRPDQDLVDRHVRRLRDDVGDRPGDVLGLQLADALGVPVGVLPRLGLGDVRPQLGVDGAGLDEGDPDATDGDLLAQRLAEGV